MDVEARGFGFWADVEGNGLAGTGTRRCQYLIFKGGCLGYVLGVFGVRKHWSHDF